MRSLALLAALALSLSLVTPAGVGAAGTPAVAPATPTDESADRAAVTPTAVEQWATPTVVEQADSPNESNQTNQTNQTRVLAVPESAVEESQIGGATLNLGPATEFNGNVTAVEVETEAVIAYVEAAETDSERSRRIIQSSSEVETEIITLRDRQHAAIRAYNAGELDAEAFVIELATVAAKAEALETRVNRLNDQADEVEGFSLSRSAAIRYELRSFSGPVRDRAVDAIRGTQEPTQFFVTTGDQGYELTVVDNETYQREAYRGAARSGDSGATMESDEAYNVTRDSYPEFVRSGDSSSSAAGTTNIVTISGTDQELTAYVDSGSERVFKEYQEFSLSTYHSNDSATNTVGGISVVVNQTYPGGPMRVHIEDAESGDPIDLAISLSQGQSDRITVGRTGDDGTLWTVSPRGSFTVLAVGDDTTAAYVETNSTDAPAIDD
ncbi:MAG: DUF7096 domain-containing protein [Halolamina sp.]